MLKYILLTLSFLLMACGRSSTAEFISTNGFSNQYRISCATQAGCYTKASEVCGSYTILDVDQEKSTSCLITDVIDIMADEQPGYCSNPDYEMFIACPKYDHYYHDHADHSHSSSTTIIVR